MFFLEVIIGQYTSEGGITCWEKICPLFSGEYGTAATRGLVFIGSANLLLSTCCLPGTSKPHARPLAWCPTQGSSQYMIQARLLTVTAQDALAVPASLGCGRIEKLGAAQQYSVEDKHPYAGALLSGFKSRFLLPTLVALGKFIFLCLNFFICKMETVRLLHRVTTTNGHVKVLCPHRKPQINGSLIVIAFIPLSST